MTSSTGSLDRALAETAVDSMLQLCREHGIEAVEFTRHRVLATNWCHHAKCGWYEEVTMLSSIKQALAYLGY